MTRLPIVALAMVLCAQAQAASPRQCAACKDSCDRQTNEGDKVCCEKAQGTRTSDYCLSNRPDDYSACAKKLVDMRDVCKATCNRAACAR